MTKTLLLILVIALTLGLLFFALRPTPQEEAGPQERTVDLEIQGNAMTPDEVNVEEGDLAILRIAADHPIAFHMHGYDLEEEVSPDEPAEISFEADVSGRFEIEDEETHTELGTLVVEPRQGG